MSTLETVVDVLHMIAMLLLIVYLLELLGVLGRCRRKVWGDRCGDPCPAWRRTCLAHRLDKRHGVS